MLLTTAATAAAIVLAAAEPATDHGQQCDSKCWEQKFQQLDRRVQPHDDMWDPNWISSVQPERSAAADSVKNPRVRRVIPAAKRLDKLTP